MLQEGLTCITCLAQVVKVISLFQAATEAEMKQLQSRWVWVHTETATAPPACCLCVPVFLRH